MIHYKYNNGIKCYKDVIFKDALKRYEKYVNVHEPFEEIVFEHILKNEKINTFVDVGAAWGYYSLFAKKVSPHTSVIAFDPVMGYLRGR